MEISESVGELSDEATIRLAVKALMEVLVASLFPLIGSTGNSLILLLKGRGINE